MMETKSIDNVNNMEHDDPPYFYMPRTREKLQYQPLTYSVQGPSAMCRAPALPSRGDVLVARTMPKSL